MRKEHEKLVWLFKFASTEDKITATIFLLELRKRKEKHKHFQFRNYTS